MKSLRNPLLLFLAAITITAACEEFPEALDPSASNPRVNIVPLNWAEVVALGDTVDLEVDLRVDGQALVSEVSVDWAVTQGGLEVPGSSNPRGQRIAGVGLGSVEVTVSVSGSPFQNSSFDSTMTVVLAGVAVTAPQQDTVITAQGDEITFQGRGKDAYDADVQGSGLSWRVSGDGVLEVTSQSSDQMVATATGEGVDTVFVSHATCAGTCEDRIIVTVDQQPTTVEVTPPQDTLVAEDVVTLTTAATDANGNAITTESYTWASSNTAVATVDASGVVTAVGAGSATITATAENDSSATSTIEVLDGGVIQVSLTDAPADLLSSAVVYFGGVYIMDNQTSHGRRYIEDTPFSQDLLLLSASTLDLGHVRVPVGTYGNIFLQVDSARITLKDAYTFEDGTRTRSLLPPSESADSLAAQISGSATLAANDTVGIIIDFDVDNSFPLPEPDPSTGVVGETSFQPETRVMREADAGSMSGAVSTTGTAAVSDLTMKAVRTDILGDTVFARTGSTGTYTFRYLVPGTYTVTMPAAPACHVASPASIADQIVPSGGALANVNFSVEPVTVDSVVIAPAMDTINAIGYSTQLTGEPYEGTAALEGLAITWSSLDPTLATVDANGTVTAVATGTARIVATSCAKADTSEVFVRQIAGSVVVSPASAEVEAGQTQQFAATLQDSAGVEIPGATFSWSSSDDATATVDMSGLATAVKSGSAQITAEHLESAISGSATLGIAIATAEKISMSAMVGCVLTSSGEILCWGRNPYGATGVAGSTGDWDDFTAPNSVSMPAGHTWVEVAAGQIHACALNSAGDIYCWGHGNSGEIGHGLYSSVDATPTLVSEPTALFFTSVSAAQQYTCATTDTNEAYCWGWGSDGRLGNGSSSNQNVPTKVFQLAGVNFAKIATSDYGTTCALSSTGLAYCWGNNNYGQLGNDTFGSASSPQAVVMPSGVTFTQLALAQRRSCALGDDGGVYCWGENNQVIVRGDGSQQYYTVPQRVGVETFTAIGAANQAVCATKSDGSVLCSGNNHSGVFGSGTNTATGAHWQPGASGILVSQLDGSAWDTMCGVATTGEAYCWGNKDLGLLGTGQTGRTHDPMQVSLTDVISADRSSRNTSCALTGAGKLWCWQDINHLTGHTNREEYGNMPDPVEITALPAGETYTEVGVTDRSVCLLTSDGDIYCMGENWQGQLGDSTYNSSTLNWVKALAPSGFTFQTLTSGEYHHCAMASDGNPYCWGAGWDGRLGTGDQNDANAPTAVMIPSGVTFTDVKAGANHTCASAASGATYCWGSNWEGQLGTGSTNQGTAVPVQVQTTVAFEKVVPGDQTTCALDASGAAYCWGRGWSGELGNNSTNSSSTPVEVGGFHVFTDIFVATQGSCGVKSDASLLCWGGNYSGMFGNGTRNQATTPASAYTGLSVQRLVGYDNVSHVLTTTGQVWSAGHHDHGATGVGLRAYEVVPVRVGGAGSN